MHLAAVSRCITRGLLTFIASYGWSWLPLTSHNRYLPVGENWGFERVEKTKTKQTLNVPWNIQPASPSDFSQLLPIFMQLGSRELMMYYIDLKRTNDVLLTFEALKVNYIHNAKKKKKKACCQHWKSIEYVCCMHERQMLTSFRPLYIAGFPGVGISFDSAALGICFYNSWVLVFFFF